MISVTESRKAFFCRLHPSLCSTISRLSRPTWQSKNSSCRCFTPRSVGASGKYGCLTVHVDPAKFLLADRHKVVFCLAFRVVRHFQTHRRTGQQQFPAPPGVLDMDGFHCSIHFHMGNKAVGTVNKNAVCALSEARPVPDSGHFLSAWTCTTRYAASAPPLCRHSDRPSGVSRLHEYTITDKHPKNRNPAANPIPVNSFLKKPISHTSSGYSLA